MTSKKDQVPQITRQAFEIRYKQSFLIWDSAGKIWTDLSEGYTVTKNNTAEPNVVRQTLDKEFDVSVALDRAHIVWAINKKNEDDFFKLCEKLVVTCIKYLSVDQFTRMGCRLVYTSEVDSLEQASEYFQEKGYIETKKGSFFNIKGKTYALEKTRRWEDEEIGVVVKLSTVETTLNTDLPIEWAAHVPTEKKIVSIVKDIDYYTKKSVAAGQLDSRAWLTQAEELVDKDLDNFLRL